MQKLQSSTVHLPVLHSFSCLFLVLRKAPQNQVPQTQPNQALCRLILRHHNYPDTIFTTYVLSGMQHGFPIGHTAPFTREMSSENHPSASRNIHFVSDHLVSCCSEGQTWGPFHTPPFPHVQVPGLGVLSKKNGKFRVTHNLSSPIGIALTTQSLPVRSVYNTNQWTPLLMPS